VNLKDIRVDKKNQLVSFGSGVIYSELIKVLEANGLALRNVPSLPHISCVGSVITSTHGGSIYEQQVANFATGLQIVLANG